MSWEEAAAIWVPELGMSFGQYCSALKKIQKAYRVARQKGYADDCLMLDKGSIDFSDTGDWKRPVVVLLPELTNSNLSGDIKIAAALFVD